MAGHYLKKRLRSAFFARRLAGFAGILLAASVLVFRRRGVDFDAFSTLVGFVGAMVVAAILLALLCLLRVWRRGHEGGGAALAALFIAFIVAAPFGFAGFLALQNPAAGMAQTDGMAGETPDLASGLGGASGEAAISGRVFQARASQIYQAVRRVLGDVGWSVADVETAYPQETDEPSDAAPDDMPPATAGAIPVPTPRAPPGGDAGEGGGEPDPLDRPESGEYRIMAVAASPILALPSDVEIVINEDDEQGYLDMRSTSRLGTRDFGQNRRFIEDFLARVDAAMVGTTTPAPG